MARGTSGKKINDPSDNWWSGGKTAWGSYDKEDEEMTGAFRDWARTNDNYHWGKFVDDNKQVSKAWAKKQKWDENKPQDGYTDLDKWSFGKDYYEKAGKPNQGNYQAWDMRKVVNQHEQYAPTAGFSDDDIATTHLFKHPKIGTNEKLADRVHMKSFNIPYVQDKWASHYNAIHGTSDSAAEGLAKFDHINNPAGAANNQDAAQKFKDKKTQEVQNVIKDGGGNVQGQWGDNYDGQDLWGLAKSGEPGAMKALHGRIKTNKDTGGEITRDTFNQIAGRELSYEDAKTVGWRGDQGSWDRGLMKGPDVEITPVDRIVVNDPPKKDKDDIKFSTGQEAFENIPKYPPGYGERIGAPPDSVPIKDREVDNYQDRIFTDREGYESERDRVRNRDGRISIDFGWTEPNLTPRPPKHPSRPPSAVTMPKWKKDPNQASGREYDTNPIKAWSPQKETRYSPVSVPAQVDNYQDRIFTSREGMGSTPQANPRGIGNVGRSSSNYFNDRLDSIQSKLTSKYGFEMPGNKKRPQYWGPIGGPVPYQ